MSHQSPRDTPRKHRKPPCAQQRDPDRKPSEPQPELGEHDTLSRRCCQKLLQDRTSSKPKKNPITQRNLCPFTLSPPSPAFSQHTVTPEWATKDASGLLLVSSEELLAKEQAGSGPREQRGCRNICWAQETLLARLLNPTLLALPVPAHTLSGSHHPSTWRHNPPARKEEWLKSRTGNAAGMWQFCTGEHWGLGHLQCCRSTAVWGYNTV